MTVQPAKPLQGIKTVSDLQQATQYAASRRRTECGNTANALWAGAALAKYGAVCQGEWSCEVGTVFEDLLGDMLHLADALGIDFEEHLHVAEKRYTEEVDDG